MIETPDDTFTTLLARVRDGDEAAAAQLVEQFTPLLRRAVHGLLGRVLRPYLDTMDVTQSVYRILLIGLREERFDISSPNQLIGLALTLLRRKVARSWRQLQRRPGGVHPGALHAGTVVLPELMDPAQPDPADTALWADEAEYLLGGLPEVDRRLLRLRLQGHSTADAARELGLDPGVLRVRLARLRKQLHEQGLGPLPI